LEEPTSRLDELLGINNVPIQDKSFSMRFLSWLGKRLGKDIISKISRARNPSHVLAMDARLRKPRYDFVTLWESWQHSWSLEAVSRAITQEITRNGWENLPKFKVKCEGCGREYQETVEECCKGKELLEPKKEQLAIADRITTKPNKDWDFDEYLRSLIEYELGLGNDYISFGRRKLGDAERIDEWYVEDTRFIIPLADVYNRLGDPKQYFCPYCWDKGIEALGRIFDKDTLPYEKLNNVLVVNALTLPVGQRENPTCQVCGRKLIRTAYVELVNGRVQSRWGEDEMIHGSMERVAPRLHGVSKLVVLWKVVETLLNMDDYNWEVYGKGHVGKFIEMPGYDEHEIAQVKTRIEQELQSLDKRDVQTGNVRLSKKIRVVLLGGKRNAEPFREMPFMPDPKQMQSLEYYMLYWGAINAVYGVQATFVSMPERGGTGSTPILRIRVQDRTTKDYQKHFENLFNMKVYPKFKITDWIFKFKKVEERDELRDAQIGQTKAATALTWRRAGVKIKIDDKGDVHPIPGDVKEPLPETRFRGSEPRREEQGVATGVASVRPEDTETRESEETGELVQR